MSSNHEIGGIEHGQVLPWQSCARMFHVGGWLGVPFLCHALLVAWSEEEYPVLTGAYVQRTVQQDNVVVEEWSQQECIQDFIHISLPSQFEETTLDVDKAFGQSIWLGVVWWWQNVTDSVNLSELPELMWGKLCPVVADECVWNTMLGATFTKCCHCLPGRHAGHWNNIRMLWVGIHDVEEVPSQMWTSEVYVNVLPRFCCWRPWVQCCLERLLCCCCCCCARPAQTNHFFNVVVHARPVHVFAREWHHSLDPQMSLVKEFENFDPQCGQNKHTFPKQNTSSIVRDSRCQ